MFNPVARASRALLAAKDAGVGPQIPSQEGPARRVGFRLGAWCG